MHLLPALTASALTGLAWWASLTPRALPLLPILLGHFVGGLALGALLRRWGLRSWLVAWAMGALVAPAALTPLHEAGWLGGPTGAAVDLAVLLGATLLGALAGAARPRLAAPGGLALLAALVGMGLAGEANKPGAEQPRASRQVAAWPDRPVAVLGIDGADWRVMDPLLARGELPVLAGLIARGRHGVLRSMEPMASPVIWTSIFTGATPSTHGLTDWLRSDARSRRVPTLADLYDAHGQPSLTLNVPGSWPPPPALDHGVLVSGFPIPGLAGGDTGHLLGRVVSSGDDEGPVPTTRAVRDGLAFVATLPLATPELRPVLPGVEHVLLRLAVREALLPVEGPTLTLRLTPEGGALTVDGDFTGAPLRLEVGAWSPWVEVRRPGLAAVLRLHALAASPEGVQLYVSPTVQDPRAPRHAQTVGLDDLDLLVDAEGPYVVEGLGWTAHRDPRVAHLVPGLLFDEQDARTRGAERLLARGPVALFAYVFTATDRIQHPFWSLHEPGPYGDWQPPPALLGQDPVAEAYRRADEALGRLIARLPQDTLLFVVSDHGADPHDGRMDEGEAGHRSDGVWIAAGPGVPASAERLELRVIDVVPTLLRCVGAPLALDFDGRAEPGVCPEAPQVPPVASYQGEPGAAAAGGFEVTQEQLDQIQALGYME